MGRPDRAPTRAPRRAFALGTTLLCAAALATTSAQAVPTGSDPGKEKKKVDTQVDRLKDSLDDTSADLAAAYVALQKTKDAMPAARSAMAQAQAKAAAADRANAVAAQELEAAVASEKKAQDQLRKTTKEVTESRNRVAQFAAQIYQEQGFGQLDMALTSSDPQQFADRIALVDTVMDVQSEAMERLTTERASLTALEDHLSALRVDSAAKKKQAEAALAKAQAARDAATSAKVALDALAARQLSQSRTVQAKLARDRSRLTSLRGRAEPPAHDPRQARRRGQEARRGQAPGRREGRARPQEAQPGRRRLQRRLEAPEQWRLPQPPQQRAGQLGVRPALPPDLPLLEAALGPRLRRPLRLAGPRRRRWHRHQRRRRWWLRQPRRHRPRPRLRRGPGDDVQPPPEHPEVERAASRAARSSATRAAPAPPPAATCTSRPSRTATSSTRASGSDRRLANHPRGPRDGTRTRHHPGIPGG